MGGGQVLTARWLLHRLGEDFGIVTTFNPKPVKGDWNGARRSLTGAGTGVCPHFLYHQSVQLLLNNIYKPFVEMQHASS